MSILPVLLGAVLCAATGEARENPYLVRARALIHELKEEEALRALDAARRWPHNTPEQLAQVHLNIGLAQAGLAQKRAAIQAFRTALMLDPSLNRDEEWGPRVVQWFEAAKAQVLSQTANKDKEPPNATGPVAETALPGAPALEVTPDLLAVQPPSAQPLQANLPTPPADNASSRPMFWIGASAATAGVLGLVAAVLVGSHASTKADLAASSRGVGESLRQRADAEQSARTANLLYAIGGSVTAAGLVVAFSFR